MAEQRAKEFGAFLPNQFQSVPNFESHYQTTGPEIWEQTNGKVDAIVMASGTGGTLGGCSVFLKEKNPKIVSYLMDPPGSGVKWVPKDGGNNSLTRSCLVLVPELKTKEEKEKEGSSTMEGIGSSDVYLPLAKAQIDGVYQGDDQLGIEMTHFLLKHEGLFLGKLSCLI